MRKIFIITIIAFIGGTFMGFGAYLFGPAADYKTAATVNGSKIPLNIFEAIYKNSYSMMQNTVKDDLTQEQVTRIKVNAIQALVQDEIFFQQSKNYGILVSNEELKSDIESSAMFKNSEGKFDARLYYGFLRSINMTPKDYETLRKKQIAGEKLKITLASSIKIFDSELQEARKKTPDISREALLQAKANAILNEWFSSTIKNSKISSNELILK
jgi:parvulin-like peptidyl-prolyl isomerase